MRIARLEKLQAIQADKDPEAAFVEPNAIKGTVDFAASLTGLGANPFDDQLNRLVDRDSGSGRSRTPASQHALSRAPRIVHATNGRKSVSTRNASNE
jgi:hypothetical protein